MSTSNPHTTLTGLHLLLTYRCNLACEHCFVWGGPSQGGAMTQEIVGEILAQARRVASIEWIYFEGGEPFLDYPLLCWGVRTASEAGYRVGIVTNACWATDEQEARERLRPFAGLVEDLSISDDNHHDDSPGPQHIRLAREAAAHWGIPADFIRVAGDEMQSLHDGSGQLPSGMSRVVYRGRAAETLAPSVPPTPWQQFDRCPWEPLRHPERVHVDAFGHLHVCQGISMGNLFERPLADILATWDPDEHPVVGPLLAGGPAEIVRRYSLSHKIGYADACHLCYEARLQLRDSFADVLAPAAMYGEPPEQS